MVAYFFWAGLLLIVYIYIGYPMIIGLWSRLAGAARADHGQPVSQPNVTILIAAYNEEKDIEATIRNKLALNYPADLMEIVVISDCSSDRTEEIVESIADPRVRLIRQTERGGKSLALNLGVSRAKGEILVFSDANSLYDPDALARLVQNFADPGVGYVTGQMVYANPDGTVIGDGCSAYMKYENRIREYETRIGSIVGVDGGIDAMRKTLYSQLRADQLCDFILPLKTVEQGYRVVYESGALLKETALDDQGDEYRMRVRVALRALWAIKDMKHLLNPWRYRIYAWQFFSHKVLRYYAFVPLLLVMVSNVFLLGGGALYTAMFVLQLMCYAMAVAGHLWLGRGPGRLFYLPYYFALLNVACAHAFFKFIHGEKKVIWEPRAG